MDDERLMGSVPEAVKETDTVEASNKAKTQTIEQAAKELGIGAQSGLCGGKAGRDSHHPNWQAHSGATRAL